MVPAEGNVKSKGVPATCRRQCDNANGRKSAERLSSAAAESNKSGGEAATIQ